MLLKVDVLRYFYAKKSNFNHLCSCILLQYSVVLIDLNTEYGVINN